MGKLKRIEDYKKVLPIVEVYTAIQMEGSRQGYPTIIIRTTGCSHRCFFGDGGWCDSWYTSIHPEKGMCTFQDIVDLYEENPHIKDMMITGGSPTMHSALVNELTHFAHHNEIFTTIETEGSHFLETDYCIDLLSISPKFSNSVPVIGAKTPTGKDVDQRMITQHNKYRLHYENIAKSIQYHSDFHIKPVIDKDLQILPEVKDFLIKLADKIYLLNSPTEVIDMHQSLNIYHLLKSKTWCMPAGSTREQLIESYGPVMDMCRDKGYKFTGRGHIIAFDEARMV